MQSVLSFMYEGEVNVERQELSSFLAVAEDLQVEGKLVLQIVHLIVFSLVEAW
jgi:hypothetical protein